MCSLQRFFFCLHGFFSLTYLRVGRGRHVDLAYFRLMGGFYFSGMTGEATALSDVGGCPRASYKIMPQCSWCISGGIVPCCLLGQSRRVGQSQGVRKKEPGEWKKKTCIIVVHQPNTQRAERTPSRKQTESQLKASHHLRHRCHKCHSKRPTRRLPRRQWPHSAAAASRSNLDPRQSPRPT